MSYFRCTGSGGSTPATLITKNISSNGTYNASSDNADGYSQVTVAVPSLVIPVTQAEYDALSTAEKNNGAAYYIEEVSTPLDMTDATITKQSAMTISGGNGTLSATLSSGSQIGGAVNKQIDTTNYESLAYDVTITTLYGNGTYVNADSRRLWVAVGDTALTGYTYYTTHPNDGYCYWKLGTYNNQRIDLSNLTGNYYFNLIVGGSSSAYSNIRLCTNNKKIMYMDKAYLLD